MQNYDQLILDYLLGSTPKERYDYLMNLVKERNKLNAKVETVKVFFEGLKDTPDTATLGNLRNIINSVHEQLLK